MGLLSPERASERNIGGLQGVKRALPGNKDKKRIEKQTTCRLARMCLQHNDVLRYLYSKWDFWVLFYPHEEYIIGSFAEPLNLVVPVIICRFRRTRHSFQ